MANNRLTNNSVFIGDSIATFNSSTLPHTGALGSIVAKDGKVFQLVKFKSTSSTLAAGTPVCWQDFDDYVVSAEQDDILRSAPAGLALMAVTAGNYGFIQVRGPYATAVTEGTVVVAGATMVMGSTDGTLLKVTLGTAPTHPHFGIATAASSGSAVAIQLQCPSNGW